MFQVRVYQFSIYDGWNDELRLSSRWATREAIETIRVGIIQEQAGTLVDQAHLDKNGMTERGHDRARSDAREERMSSRVVELARRDRRPMFKWNDDG
jgi:hypothetical protein